MEHLKINYLAIVAGVVANMVIGFVWYGPLFGKKWAAEVGLPADFKPSGSAMGKSMGMMLVGAILVAYCLAMNSAAWHFLAEKTMPQPANPLMMGFSAGFYTWIGFFVPVYLNSVAFEGKSWTLFGINTGYYFVNLQVLGMILAYWR